MPIVIMRLRELAILNSEGLEGCLDIDTLKICFSTVLDIA